MKSRRSKALGGCLALVLCALLLPVTTLRQSAGEPSSSPAGEKAAPPAEPADNSYCYVCHLNYEEEKLTKAHQPVGVGCEKCHGESIKHSGDEDALSPPDRMFPTAEVNPFCMTCHEKDKLLSRDLHRDFFRDDDEEATCNDCHGEEHRIKVRTRIWDKKTGKLVEDDGVRMMLKDSPATLGADPKSQPSDSPAP
jgi:Zn finger protein HypA/HybF involved in hydrogenase expression